MVSSITGHAMFVSSQMVHPYLNENMLSTKGEIHYNYDIKIN